jgi:enoyl-CoA hydratase/carnithine racemase
MSQEFETINIEFNEKTGIGQLTLNRPEALNALNTQLREDIVAGLRTLNKRNNEGIEMRVVVLEGAEDDFCAGADINELESESDTIDVDRTHYQFISDYPVPIIAKIRGYCLGGGLETALSCDFRFANQGARFGLPEVDLGILPGAGGIQYVSRLANPSIAKELAMTANHIPAERAARENIINSVYKDSELDSAVQEFAESLADKPPLAIQAIKKSADMATQTGLREGCEYDRNLLDPLLNSEDHSEAVKAFADENYDPKFDGK